MTRDVVIQTLVKALESLGYVHAFWEGGAAAFNRIDEWSDIDLYLLVDDNKIDEIFLAVEEVLRSLSPIKQKYEVAHPPQSRVFQAFYKLEEASQFLIIDLAVLALNSPDKFLEPEIHGNVVFYFKKSDRVKPHTLDKDALIEKLHERLERLQAKFDMFNNFVQKEINRGNTLEALDHYHRLNLATLVEALRIRYNPVHHDFKMRYIHYELPSEIIERLKHLYFVKDEIELQEKYYAVTNWFYKIISEIDKMEIENLM